MKKIIIVIVLTFFAVLSLGIIFGIAIKNYKDTNLLIDEDFEQIIIGDKIANPDRIVYKDEEGNYYEFNKDTEKYNNLKALIGNSIKEYDENGEILIDENIDEIHSKSFIEFDYERISKNYLISLENGNVVKLGDSGGTIISEKIENISKITKYLKTLTKDENLRKLEYKELYSNNRLEGIEYNYMDLFNRINYYIYQVKITDFTNYEKFKEICDISVEENITEEIFLNNDIILTISSLPKIEVKVNVGNIKYTYSNTENIDNSYIVHLLIVNKIANTDCIYNTDLAFVESQILSENFEFEYDENVENLDTNIFVTNIEEFMSEYNLASSKISEEEASNVAEIGFKEAERICGFYDISTQTITKENVKPNNFFTRKYNETDTVYTQYEVEAYVFSRTDDMNLNGLKIFIDSKTGKIVGGGAFGD